MADPLVACLPMRLQAVGVGPSAVAAVGAWGRRVPSCVCGVSSCTPKAMAGALHSALLRWVPADCVSPVDVSLHVECQASAQSAATGVHGIAKAAATQTHIWSTSTTRR